MQVYFYTSFSQVNILYASILFHFDIFLSNKSLGSWNHTCLFIQRKNLRNNYFICVTVFICLELSINKLFFSWARSSLSQPSSSGRIYRKKTFKFNTKQSFVDALTWHGPEETSWKAPMQTASSKK